MPSPVLIHLHAGLLLPHLHTSEGRCGHEADDAENCCTPLASDNIVLAFYVNPTYKLTKTIPKVFLSKLATMLCLKLIVRSVLHVLSLYRMS